MRFAMWVFLVAGVSGILMVAPMYLEDRFVQEYPPPTNRPEFYYGFAGVTLAWQVMFLVIASDPARYRRALLPAMLEKAASPSPCRCCTRRGGCPASGSASPR